MGKNKSITLKIDINSFETVLNENAGKSVATKTTGEKLFAQAETYGMNENLAEEIRTYIAECSGAVRTMHEKRRPFTDALTKLQKQLVSLENAIDPKKTDSPAYNCNVVLKQYLRSVAEKARAEAARLQKNYEMSQKRISKITDEKKKAEAYNRAAERRTSGLASLQLNAVEMELIPEVMTVDGYVELFKFWWENVGKGLPDADLRRIMHPMLMFAKQQARKGVRIDSPCVEYKEEPKAA